MKCVIAVLCIAVAVYAKPAPTVKLADKLKTEISTPGKQYALYVEKTSMAKKWLPEGIEKETHKGLNLDRDGDVDADDFKLLYWHPDVEYAIKKAILFLDDDNDNKLTATELKNDHEKKAIQVALVECTYLRSAGLKQSCLADQLATYAALVMDTKDIADAFAEAGAKNNKLTAAALKTKIPGDMVGEELGAFYGTEANTVTLEEFTDYVTQESLLDDFRICRTKVDVAAGNIDFDNICIIKEIGEYTEKDLTELDIAVLFSAIDTDNNKAINDKEIKALTGVSDATKLKKIMDLLDMGPATGAGKADGVIDYPEFRTYMKSPTVEYQAEKVCTEPLDKQLDEITCLLQLFKDLVSDTHDPIWLAVPDLEQMIAFEIMDLDNDGKVEKTDLVDIDFIGVPEVHEAAMVRFIHEFDGEDDDTDVDLEEFNEYMDIPHMVYGTADCLLQARTIDGRGVCYPEEVIDIVDNIKYVDTEAWEDLFNYYAGTDGKIDEKDPTEKKLGSQELENLFLAEAGQGGNVISLFEFTWYAKQQELADRYEKKSLVVSHTGREFTTYQEQAYDHLLAEWLSDDMTEYDITELFRLLDSDKNHELTPADFPGATAELTKMLEYIDSLDVNGDEDKTVNYREFWLWLNSRNQGSATKGNRWLIKDVFEHECTIPKKTQKEELACYVALFKAPKGKLVA